MQWDLAAEQIVRGVRAYNPWPGAHTEWDGRRLRLLRGRRAEGKSEPGRVVGMRDGALYIGAGDGIVAATELQLAGSRAMSAEALVRGNSRIIGAQLR